jgi:hypothetical protein
MVMAIATGLPPYWAATWIEHWPAALQALTLPQRGLPLTPDEVCALGRRNGVAVAAFGKPSSPIHDDHALLCLAARLENLLHELGAGSAFVRLGSRSPKDTALALLGGLQVASGEAAVAALSAGSQRVGFDLRVAWQAGVSPWVWLRAWAPIAWHDEWRCLLHEGQLVGVTQYMCRASLPRSPQPAELAARLHQAAAELVGALAPVPALQTVVADMWLPPDRSVRLIELNPWGPATELGLFRWDHSDLDGTVRWREADGEHRWLLADDAGPATRASPQR